MFGVDAVDVAAWPAAVAAILTACGVIWRTAVRPVIRWGRRIETTVVFVEHELKANSGKSMRDAIDRIDTRLARGDERFDRIEQRISEQTITINTGPTPITPPPEGDPQ